MLYGMAQDGEVPRFFGLIHPRFRTPWVGILIMGVAGIEKIVVWVRAVRQGFAHRRSFLGGVYRAVLTAEIASALALAGPLRLHYAGLLLKGAPALRPVGPAAPACPDPAAGPRSALKKSSRRPFKNRRRRGAGKVHARRVAAYARV